MNPKDDMRHLVANMNQAVIDFKKEAGKGIGIDDGVKEIVKKAAREILAYLKQKKGRT